MKDPLLWLAMVAPAVLTAVGLMPERFANARARGCARAAFCASIVALGVALATTADVATRGPLHTATLGTRGLGLAIYADNVTTILFMLVAFVGAASIRYSMHYLQGDARQGCFIKSMCLTLAAALLVIVSGNVFQLLLSWIATSIGLNRLLLFYRDRQAAVLAARKKFVFSRVADVCLITAAVLMYRNVGNLDYDSILAYAHALQGATTVPLSIQVTAVLLATAAMLKSALFPVHGWLTEVMETPAPVSALLHAGIINAGGFLVLRFANVLVGSTPALDTLVILGTITAVFASLVMLTQTSIKGSLAFSTIAQMGFMMLECGLCAFSTALLHMVAHSLYKAHAFLSSGSVIDRKRISPSVAQDAKPRRFRKLGLAVALMSLLVASMIVDTSKFTLIVILLMGILQLLSMPIDDHPNSSVLIRTLLVAVVVAAIYGVLHVGAARLLDGSLPSDQDHRPLTPLMVFFVAASFGIVVILQYAVPRAAQGRRWHACYVHLANGLYVNAWFNRLAIRFWPPVLSREQAD